MPIEKKQPGLEFGRGRILTVNEHSSIRISGVQTLYFDPFHLSGAPHDADAVFLTHSHFDHFSPEDVRKAEKESTVFAAPAGMRTRLAEAGIAPERCVFFTPGECGSICGIPVEAVFAYNPGKRFHPKENGWIGYIVTLDGVRVYVCGDTEQTPENSRVVCDIMLVPAGGTYTCDAKQAAEFANAVHPKIAVPTHYGSVAGTRKDGNTFRAAVCGGIQTVLLIQ